MIKKIFLGVLAIAILWAIVAFSVVSTGQLLVVSVDVNYRKHWLRLPAFFYLQHVRGLKAFPRDTHGPPLHLIVRDCLFAEEPVCSKALVWALISGENANENDTSLLGFTPLHYSAFVCDAISARILISNGASRDSLANGEKFKGKTPFEVLSLMEKVTCPDSKNRELIESLLRDKTEQ